ncbi:unnamed protein product, partial [Effrenium voratum]
KNRSETPWPRCAGRMWRVITLLGLLCDAAGGKKPGAALKKIPARSFTMGGDELSGAPGTVQVSLQEYKIDETPVTNAHFRKFVRATKYRTDAEKFGWSFVINSSLSEAALLEAERAVQDAPQWVAVEGAWWRQPEGPGALLEPYVCFHVAGFLVVRTRTTWCSSVVGFSNMFWVLLMVLVKPANSGTLRRDEPCLPSHLLFLWMFPVSFLLGPRTPSGKYGSAFTRDPD